MFSFLLSTGEAQLMNATGPVEPNTSVNSNGSSVGSPDVESVTKGLSSWREAVQRSVTSSQLSMALYTLEQCVAWDKSIMKAVSTCIKTLVTFLIFFFHNRTASFVNQENLKTSFCYATAVIKAITLTASSPRWKKFQKAIGNYIIFFLFIF
jgi:hypothetical protein